MAAYTPGSRDMFRMFCGMGVVDLFISDSQNNSGRVMGANKMLT